MKNNIYTVSMMGIDANLIECETSMHSEKDFDFSFMGFASHKRSIFRRKLLSILSNNEIRLPNNLFVTNLLPIDIRKESSDLDLPMMVSILIAAKKLSPEAIKFLNDSIIVGELTLEGNVYPIKNVMSIALNLKKFNKKRLIIPYKNFNECEVLPQSEIYCINHISEIFNPENLEQVKSKFISSKVYSGELDINQIYGQNQAKRALEISAAGKHNLLLYGSPGSGKSMLAKRIQTILPPLTKNQILETTRIYSSLGLLDNGNPVLHRPFRSPHHSVSMAGMLGGGSTPTAGEVSLAHNGVLFMDEFVHFNGKTIESLRECLEENKVNLKKYGYSATYPADFILIAALNPCPCGFFGDKKRICTCTSHQIKLYLNKLSGPILDRIDMQVYLSVVDFELIKNNNKESVPSADIRTKVNEAIKRQFSRNSDEKYNGSLSGSEIDSITQLDSESSDYLEEVYNSLSMSMRSYHKIMKISRTIADLDDSDKINLNHIKEALSYRSFDKFIKKFDLNA